MTKAQTKIHKALITAGFKHLYRIGTRYTAYRKGYVNVSVGPRGKITCWAVLLCNGTDLTSVETKLQIEGLT